MKLISWNVNGLRAVEKKGFVEWLEKSGADIIAGGALLLSEIVGRLSLNGVYASDRDNLEGYCYLRGLK